MTQTSKIEWTEATWNPVRGCVKVSPGCAHCYAETFAERFRGVKGHAYEQGFDLRLVPEKLDEPLRRKTPTTYFVNSMSDLFQDGVSETFIMSVFLTMEKCPQHTFQILTKRAERMRDVVQWLGRKWADGGEQWPLPNVWLGVSIENQHFADERVPLLLNTPAAVRFISAEPLLAQTNLSRWLRPQGGGAGHCFDIDNNWWHEPGTCNGPICLGQCCGRGLDWVIVGGESGNGARPFDLAWARSILAQCKSAGVPCFVKQLGKFAVEEREIGTAKGGSPVPLNLRSNKGGDITEWPEDMRVRETPRPR